MHYKRNATVKTEAFVSKLEFAGKIESRLEVIISMSMKKIATAHTFCDRKQFCGENLQPQMIFCAILQRKSFAQIWCKLTQNSAKNPRNASKFLRFCVAIAPQIFATGNPNFVKAIKIRENSLFLKC